jgi:hypothetical protein
MVAMAASSSISHTGLSGLLSFMGRSLLACDVGACKKTRVPARKRARSYFNPGS